LQSVLTPCPHPFPAPAPADGYGKLKGKCERCTVAMCDSCYANATRCEECVDGHKLADGGSRCVKEVTA